MPQLPTVSVSCSECILKAAGWLGGQLLATPRTEPKELSRSSDRYPHTSSPSVIHNSQKVDAAQASTDGRMGEHPVGYAMECHSALKRKAIPIQAMALLNWKTEWNSRPRPTGGSL